jgi:hypothetical protein
MNREFADIVERAVIVALTAYVVATMKGLVTVVKSPSRQQPARLSQISDSFRKASSPQALLASHSQRMFC